VPEADGRSVSAAYPADGPEAGRCLVRTPADAGDPFEIALDFSSDTLPFLQVWRDLRPGVCVVAVEPCTSDRTAAGTSVSVVRLEPGESRSYRVRLALSGIPGPIRGARPGTGG
jgi:hypothetical protein